MKNNIITRYTVLAVLTGTVGIFAQDKPKWDVNLFGLFKVGKNAKGEDCVNIGLGLFKVDGKKVDLCYGLFKVDDQKKATLFGKEIKPSKTNTHNQKDSSFSIFSNINWNWNRGNSVTTTTGTKTITIGDNSVIGGIRNGNIIGDIVINGVVIGNGSNGVTSNTDSVTISNSVIINDDKPHKTVKLTGTKKRVPLSDAVDTISMPASLAHVTIDDIEPYMECDEAVFGSGLELGVEDGKLRPTLGQKKRSIRFKGTAGKPLCTMSARMRNDALYINDSSKVHITTPSAKRITTSSYSDVSIGDRAANIESIDASGSSKVSLSHAPELKQIIASSYSDVSSGNGVVNVQSINASGSAQVNIPNAPMLKKIVTTSFSEVSTGDSATNVESIDASGSSKVVVPNAPVLKKIVTSSFANVLIGDNPTSLESIDAHGSSEVTVRNLNTKILNAVLDSFARVTIQGAVNKQWVTASGSSQYKASGLKSNSTTVDASSFASVKLWVNRVLNGWADGYSSVRYRGNAASNVQTSRFASCKKTHS